MYKQFYNLKHDPFRLTPDPAFICMTPQHREALSGLVYSVCTRPGLTVLVGEVGTGKTTLLYTLMGLLEKRKFVTGMCTNPTLTREEFYDFLMAKLGVECTSSLKSRQLIALQETLGRNRAAGRPSVLIVDEAQKLSAELLEEIRLLMNLETPSEKLLEIIMAGQPELMEILRRPQLRQIKQRVSYFCKLEPLSLTDLRDYLDHRLARAGLPQQNLFSEVAIRCIYEFTNGIPRLVNSLCDSTLQIGFALKSPEITISMIGEAAADLDLIPNFVSENLPSNGNQPISASASPQPGPKGVDDHRSPSGSALELDQNKKGDGKSGPSAPAVPDVGGNGQGGSAIRIPLEGYETRQKSLGFLAGLLDRWR